MEWVTSLSAQGLQPKIIKVYLTSLHSLHIDSNLPFMACKAPVVQHLIWGIKHYHGECAWHPKLLITLNILWMLCMALSELMSAINHTMKAVMTLTFTGFLHCGKFTLDRNAQFNPAVNLMHGSVKFIPDLDYADQIILTLPALKTVM